MSTDPMPAELPLSILVPAGTVGITVAWRNEDGTLGVAWRDVSNGVPIERAGAARILRLLADSLEEESRKIGAS